MATRKQLSKEAKDRTIISEDKVEVLIENLQAFLQRNIRKILEGLREGTLTAKEAAKALGGLQTAIEDAGLSKQFDRLRGLFSSEFKEVEIEFEKTTGKKALLSDFAKANLNAIVDDRLNLASSVISQYVNDVRSVVLDSVLAGKEIKPTDILKNAEGATLRNLKTEINTSMMAFQRAAHLEKAKKAGITKFLYVGPDDDVIRPFCQDHVEGIYTLDEINEMDNEQGLPVIIYGGGYNCRHHWRPISDDLAAELEGEE